MNDDRDTRDIALEAKSAIDHHVLECDKRYSVVCGQIKNLNINMEKGHELLHERLSAINSLFHSRWWTVAASFIGFLFLLCLGLLGYIWETRG